MGWPWGFLDVLLIKELLARFLEVFILEGMRAGDCGQNRVKRGDGLEVRSLQGLALCCGYFTSKYIPSYRFVKRKIALGVVF